MLDLAYVTLLDFLSRSPPRGSRDEACESRFVPVGEDTDGREKAAPPEPTLPTIARRKRRASSLTLRRA